jgi:hypothetical protein
VNSVQALSLGGVANPIYIGKPFFASIALSDAEGAVGCIRTQLSYGDTTVSNVSFQQQANAIVVRSARPIDEPIVNLVVTADCDAPITRSYALFAEMTGIATADSNEYINAAKTVTPYANAVPPNSSLNFFGIPSSLDGDSKPTNATKNSPERLKHKRSRSDLDHASLSDTPPRQKPEDKSHANRSTLVPSANLLGTRAASPRLEIDDSDWIEQAPQLHLDDALRSTVSADQNIREEARTRWMALSQQMAGTAGAANADRLRAVDAEEKNSEFQAQIQHSEAQIQRLQTQLNEEKKAAFVLRSILLGLFGVALLGLGVWLFGRWRARKTYLADTSAPAATPWWQQNAADITDAGHESPPIKRTAATNLTGYLEELPVPEVDFSTDVYSDFAALDTIPEALATPSALNKKTINIGIEGLQSIQEQADFFAALGQFEQAESLLRRFISENPATSPLAYLSLLSLYYNAQRYAAFDALREHYNRTFNAQIPNFESFKTDQRGLDSYPETIAHIQQLWGTSDVIRLIEESLFKTPDAQSESTFAPLAYRELLLLYGIATETIASPEDITRMRAVAADAQRWLQPASALAAAATTQPQESIPSHSSLSVLDHDLDHLSDSTPAEHMNLDLNLNGLSDIEVDLRLPDTPTATNSIESSNSIDFDLESSDFDPTETLASEIDFSLDDLEKTNKPDAH